MTSMFVLPISRYLMLSLIPWLLHANTYCQSLILWCRHSFVSLHITHLLPHLSIHSPSLAWLSLRLPVLFLEGVGTAASWTPSSSEQRSSPRSLQKGSSSVQITSEAKMDWGGEGCIHEVKVGWRSVSNVWERRRSRCRSYERKCMMAIVGEVRPNQ